MVEWKKAGRPRKSEEPKKSKPWTKEELALISSVGNNAYVMLGIAVVRQWIKDGKPQNDKEGIQLWLGIIQDSLKDKDNKHLLPKLPIGDDL